MHYKKITSEKKGFPPSPQVFRNSFKKMYGAELRYGLKNEKKLHMEAIQKTRLYKFIWVP